MESYLQPLHLLIFSIVLLVFLVVVFSVFVLLHRLWMIRVEAYRSRMQKRWMEAVFGYIADQTPASEISAMVGPDDIEPFTSAVVHLLESIDGEEREKLKTLFQEIGIVRHYLSILTRRSRWQKMYAIHFLGMIREPAAVPALVSLLDDADDVVAFAAAQSLARIRDRQHLPRILEVLTRRESWTENTIAEILLEFGPEISGDLLPLLERPDLSERARLLVVELLGYLRHLHALPALIRLLDETTDRELQIHLLRALGRLASPESAPATERYVDHPDPIVRLHAVRALGQMGRDSSRERLRTGLDDADWNVRHESAWGLIQLGPSGLAELRERAAATGHAGTISRQVLAEYEHGVNA